MKNWMVVFTILLILGGYLWPWLRELGLAHLPGDIALDWQGLELKLPVGTALLITGILVGVWRLLDRNS